jgi:RimJ/RimL family protein N-acetyltransferase
MKSAVALRRARPADCERVWAYNFAPDVRAVSGSSEPVSAAAHAAWYTRRLAEIDAPMWIIESEGEAVGVIRIDRILGPTRFGRISIALDRAARGRGIGQAAIIEATRAWAGPTLAEIHPDNTASRVAFEACGFALTGAPQSALLSYAWSP